MRKIKLKNWKIVDPEGKEGEENLLLALNVLIANKKPEEMPRGLEKFKLFNKLSKAFEKAEETGELVLEESEYEFIKETMEKDIPSIWGANKNLSEAIEAFLDAKEE